MVTATSAVAAILLNEAEATRFAEAIELASFAFWSKAH